MLSPAVVTGLGVGANAMKDHAASKPLCSIANSTHKLLFVCVALCIILICLLLLESCRTHRSESHVIIAIDISKSRESTKSANQQYQEYPQGPDAAFWPSSAQEFLQIIQGILQRYFPADMPHNGPTLNNKQQYIKTHLPRFVHTLYRAKQYIQPGASIVALGEKGHVPALLHELFKPNLLKVTTMDSPGVLVLKNTANNQSIQVEQLQHNAELEPLPFASNSIDHIFFLEVLEHLTTDPFFAILEMHRVLKANGTLFLSTPNLGSISSLARLYDGWSPYAYSKYLSNKAGEGAITHVREYTWRELERYLYVAGFEPELKSFSPYKGDKEFWDFALQSPKARYQLLLESLQVDQQTLDKYGSTAFVIATKAREPFERRPWQLYAYATQFTFEGYPACKYKAFEKLCAPAPLTDAHTNK